VQRLISELSTRSLERLVSVLETRLIAGTASGHDVETYMLMQMELGERLLGTTNAAPDGRD
jgi:hypothetical protein